MHFELHFELIGILAKLSKHDDNTAQYNKLDRFYKYIASEYLICIDISDNFVITFTQIFFPDLQSILTSLLGFQLLSFIFNNHLFLKSSFQFILTSELCSFWSRYSQNIFIFIPTWFLEWKWKCLSLNNGDTSNNCALKST